MKNTTPFALLFSCLFLMITSLILLNSAYADQSMRRCMLLPIQDNVGGAIGFKVFEEIETYLIDSDWCYYRPNSEIINILQNYKKNLDHYLDNKDVLKTIAQKMKAGSLIKVQLVDQIDGVEIFLKIMGDNGEDLYFEEKVRLARDNIALISQTIVGWLKDYSMTIPYDGQIVGVLGGQFTIDVGKEVALKEGKKVNIVRLVGTKKHPLLKKIVDWEVETIGKGKILNASNAQALGQLEGSSAEAKIKIGDWVRLDHDAPSEGDISNFDQEAAPGYEFGKLGILGLFLEFGGGEASNVYGGSGHKVGGSLVGLKAQGEAWITRNYWLALELERKMGFYKKKTENLSQSTYSLGGGEFALAAGYRYLPLGFFYGPQVNLFLGFARFSFELEHKEAEGWGQASFKGPLLGVRGEAPIYNRFKIFLTLDFLLTPSYDEDQVLYGKQDSATSYGMEAGFAFAQNLNMSLVAAFELDSHKAKFKTINKEVSFQETTLKTGLVFNY